jgi:Carboxypeptidase regulatory-like domain
METFRLAPVVFLLAVPVMAQDPPPAARKASISGVVRYAGWSTPVPLASVSTEGADPVMTDIHGRYTIPDLPPGRYQLEVKKDGSRTLSRKIVLAGFDLTTVDINFRINGTVSGRVLDDNREPVADAIVSVVTRTYYLGQLQSRRTASATTNARGAYRIPGVATGEPVLLLATKFAEKNRGHLGCTGGPQGPAGGAGGHILSQLSGAGERPTTDAPAGPVVEPVGYPHGEIPGLLCGRRDDDRRGGAHQAGLHAGANGGRFLACRRFRIGR